MKKGRTCHKMRAQTNSSLMLWLAIVFGVLFPDRDSADQKETPQKAAGLKNGNLKTRTKWATQSISGPISISESKMAKCYSHNSEENGHYQVTLGDMELENEISSTDSGIIAPCFCTSWSLSITRDH
ncbi:Lysenin, partial [Orchesella cincta]